MAKFVDFYLIVLANLTLSMLPKEIYLGTPKYLIFSQVASFGNRTSIIHMRQIFLLDTIHRDELTFVTKYSGPGLDQTKIDKTLVWSILGTEEKIQIWQIRVETRDHVWPISRLFSRRRRESAIGLLMKWLHQDQTKSSQTEPDQKMAGSIWLPAPEPCRKLETSWPDCARLCQTTPKLPFVYKKDRI